MQSSVAVPAFSADELNSIVSGALGQSRELVDVRGHSVDRFSSSVDGFLAEHFALRIDVRCDQRDRELSFFVKAFPQQNPCMVEYLESIGTFRKETTMFEEVLPRIQKAVGGKHFTAKVFLTKGNGLIVMENLKLADYEIVVGNNGLLDGFQLRKAMDALARLHAGSMIVEEQEGKSLVELFPGILDENAWVECENSVRRKDVENVILFWCEVVKFSERNPKRLGVVLNDLPKAIRRIYEYVKPSVQFRNALCHGDLWNNNLMFKSLAGIAEDCVLVDFQMSRYVPPAYDLNLLIGLSTSRIFRKRHFEDLVMDYFVNLQTLLVPRGIDFSLDTFRESCEVYRSAGIIHTCLISPEVLLPQRYLQEMVAHSDASCGFMPKSKVQICLKAFQEDIPYRNRLLDMLDELIDTEILQK